MRRRPFTTAFVCLKAPGAMDIPYAALMMFALAGLSVVLILIILLQRGRGGGLAGAFGGAGGQSALGTRAGDVFTKITIGLAVAWIVLACVNIYVLKGATERFVEAPGAGDGASLVAPDAGEGEVEAEDEDVPQLEPTEEVAVPEAELEDDDAFIADPLEGDEPGPALPAGE
ncbi:preprotein translocase subunit SecG [Alienimonas sp. DA493]|uniref:preprotein translocase subunit SecG n=1 Tax=Alienimonas sp. DA493 TaxID=3373605 RepID=UPI0037547A02